MTKKLLVLAFLALFLPTFLFAQRVFDMAELLSAPEEAALEEKLAEIASEYSFELVIVTVLNAANLDSIDVDDEMDTCFFVQVTESRDYYFAAYGRGEKILNNTAYGKLEKDVLRFLSNDDYAGAYVAFINAWEEFLALDAKGRSYNFFHQWNAVLVIIAWVIALLIGLLVVQSWKTQMNTALPQKQADPYLVPGSLAFTAKNERFLYSNVTKTKRQTQSSVSSSVKSFTSSSGRKHGGGGGKY